MADVFPLPVGCSLGHCRCPESLWHCRTSLPLLCEVVGTGGVWISRSSVSCKQHMQLKGSPPSKCWFRLQQENVVSFPNAGGGEVKLGDCLLWRHNISLLPHRLPQSILLSDESVTRGGEGDVTGVRRWNSLSSLGWKRPKGTWRGWLRH